MNRDKFDLEAYAFQIRRLSKEDGGGFVIEYPDGGIPQEAMENGRDALRSCLPTMREFGDLIQRSGSFGMATEGSQESSRTAGGSRRARGRQSQFAGKA